MKQINYYPANGGWAFMWTQFDAATIDSDFAKIAGLHGDTVRVIVQPSAIGYPAPDPAMLDKVEQVVQLAAGHGLGVHLTLFDQYPAAFTDVAGSKTWARDVLVRFWGDAAIAAVELHNEVDPTNQIVMAWVKQLLPYVRKVSGHPCTVSIADKGVTAFKSLVSQLAQTPPDFWDYHYYGSAAFAANVLGAVKAACKGRPLLIGETGQSTYGQADLNVQANYLTYIAEACAYLGLSPPAPWILSDFTPTGIPGGSGSGPQYEFGLFRPDGSAKPSAAAVAAMFTP